MAGKVSEESSGPTRMNELETTTPPTPPAGTNDPPHYDAGTETPREKKRREWQENKIRQSREKSHKKVEATATEQDGAKLSPSDAYETHDASQDRQTSGTAGGRVHPPVDRTPGQWKTIRKLKLCARCLNLTIPPHKPTDAHARCTGQQNAPWDKSEIDRIRKASNRLAGRNIASERVQAEPTQQNGPWPRERARSRSIQHIQPQNNSPCASYSNIGRGEQFPPFFGIGNLSAVPGTSEGFNTLSAQRTVFHGSISSHHPSSRLHQSAGYNGHRVTQSHSSDTQVGDLYGSSAADGPCIVRSPQYVRRQSTKPRKLLEERNMDVVGIDPPTPLIPTIQIDEALGVTDEPPQNTAVMPDPESSNAVPRLSGDDRTWDDETKVLEGPIGPGHEIVVVEGFTTSERLIEKLLPEIKVVPPVDRTLTLKGSFFCSSVSAVPA